MNMKEFYSGSTILEKMAKEIEQSGKIEISYIEGIVNFFKLFADKCHHGKEEGFMFPAMQKAGLPNEGGPIGQMLLEQHSGGPMGGYKFTVQKPGSFAEYFHVNNVDMNAALLTDDITLEQAVMITDMMTTGFHGAENAEIENINFFSEVDTLPIPRIGQASGMANKTIIGGLCPGGRRRLEMVRDLIRYNRIDPSRLITHRYNGLEHIEEAFMLMKDKPKDLIKPVVIV